MKPFTLYTRTSVHAAWDEDSKHATPEQAKDRIREIRLTSKGDLFVCLYDTSRSPAWPVPLEGEV